jgi:pimeloyl-ACP methyl ester carboxylesterase
MTTTLTTGVVRADGADLYTERRGDGPPLLLIAGGGGDCGAFSALADLLASRYTVLSYDRRGNSRSPLHHEPAAITIVRPDGYVAWAAGPDSPQPGRARGRARGLDEALHAWF